LIMRAHPSKMIFAGNGMIQFSRICTDGHEEEKKESAREDGRM